MSNSRQPIRNRLMRVIGWSLACVLVVGCSGPKQEREAPREPVKATTDRGSACDAIADWRSERIPMPPEWAPRLPKGYELLRFAPGMYQADAVDYFSYVFTLMWETQPDLDHEQLTDIIEQYYRGLVRAVADAKKLDIPAEDVTVAVTGRTPDYRVSVSMYEPFVTGERIALDMDIHVGVSCILAKVSPQPREHAVWTDLERAAACLPCP